MATDSTTAVSARVAVMERMVCVRNRTTSACSSVSDTIIYTPTESEEDMEEDGGKSPECSLRCFIELSKDKTEGSESTSSLKKNDTDTAGNPDEVSCKVSDLSEEEMDDSNANRLLARAKSPDSDDNAKLDEIRNPCFDAPVNSMNESEPNPRLRLFPKRDAKSTTCGYHTYGKNDQSTPTTFNEAWRSKFWLSDGHRRVLITSLMSSEDKLKTARIEHDLWTISAQSTALELAQSAQASYKEFVQGLQGEFRKLEAGDKDVNLEGSFHPLFWDNSFEIVIKDLLKATLKAREAMETAEALALYPSHLINHLDDVDELRKCLDKIEERYRELGNIDATSGRTPLAPTVSAILDKDIAHLTMPKAAENDFTRTAKKETQQCKRDGAKHREMRESTPDATSSKLAGSDVKDKEAVKQNKINASQEPAILIMGIVVIQSLLWSTMMLRLPRYMTLSQTNTLVGVQVAKDLCDLYRNRSWFWNSEASVVITKVQVIRRILNSQAIYCFIAWGYPPSIAICIAGLVPFNIDILRGRHFDWVVARTLHRSFFAKYYDRATASVQGPFPQKLTDSPAFTRLGSFDLNPQTILYSFLWNYLLNVACLVLLYILIFSHDSPASKGLALMTIVFLGSTGFPRPGFDEEGERMLSIINREHAFTKSSGSVRRPSWKIYLPAIELSVLAIVLLYDCALRRSARFGRPRTDILVIDS